MVCPPGLVSTNIKIVHATVEMKGQRAISERSPWNASSTVDDLADRLSSSKPLEVLKQTPTKSPTKAPPGSQEEKISQDKKLNILKEIEDLEGEMKQSEMDMEDLEIDLANRYYMAVYSLPSTYTHILYIIYIYAYTQFLSSQFPSKIHRLGESIKFSRCCGVSISTQLSGERKRNAAVATR
jgi:hypothetical protein